MEKGVITVTFMHGLRQAREIRVKVERVLGLAALVSAAGLAGGAVAQGGAAPFGGTAPGYTAGQAERGKAVYEGNCLACHGVDAAGGQFGPQLRGAPFMAHWTGQPASALFSYIQTNMPPGRRLSAGNYADVEAYLLQLNGMPAGEAELAAEGSAGAPAPVAAVPGAPAGAYRSPAGFARPEPNRDAFYTAEMARRADKLAKLPLVTEAMLANPAQGDWLMWRRAWSGQGFSPLKQITPRNAGKLRQTWSATLRPSLNEITPLVHDGVMFVFSGDTIQAYDAANGDMLWEYVRPLPDALNGGRNLRNKSMAIHGDTIYAPTADMHLIALDMRTGKLKWDHEVLTPEQRARGVLMNGAPIVAKGKVMMGVSLSISLKGGCWSFALDEATGKEVWRFETIAKPGEVGGDSWNAVPRDERFGGAVWTMGSYDPALNLVYFGVGNTYDTEALLTPKPETSPANSGLFTESTVAINPDTGKLAWHYQHMQRDVWDMDWAFEQTLVDMPVAGRMRKLLVTGSKLAIFDAIDRTDGSYVFSRDLGFQNLVSAIDPKTGAKSINPALTPEAGVTKLLCPGANGIRNWPATAYDPVSHILYVPAVDACSNFTWSPKGTGVRGGNDQRFQTRTNPKGDGMIGMVEAIDLVSGKTVWRDKRRAAISSSMLATGGGVVFNAGRDRYFRAFDSKTGKVVWETRLDMPASASPITYSVNGQQYVAVTAGGGNPQDTAFAPLTPEIVSPVTAVTLWVFKLP